MNRAQTTKKEKIRNSKKINKKKGKSMRWKENKWLGNGSMQKNSKSLLI